MADPVLSARSRLANAHRRADANSAVVADAKRELNAAHVERAIQKALDTAPPLTADQRARLAALLVGGAK